MAEVNISELKEMIKEEISKKEDSEMTAELKRLITDLTLENRKMVDINLALQSRIVELMINVTEMIKNLQTLTKTLQESLSGGEEENEEEESEEGTDNNAVKMLAIQNKQMLEVMSNLEKYIKRLYRKDIISNIRSKKDEISGENIDEQ